MTPSRKIMLLVMGLFICLNLSRIMQKGLDGFWQLSVEGHKKAQERIIKLNKEMTSRISKQRGL